MDTYIDLIMTISCYFRMNQFFYFNREDIFCPTMIIFLIKFQMMKNVVLKFPPSILLVVEPYQTAIDSIDNDDGYVVRDPLILELFQVDV